MKPKARILIKEKGGHVHGLCIVQTPEGEQVLVATIPVAVVRNEVEKAAREGAAPTTGACGEFVNIGWGWSSLNPVEWGRKVGTVAKKIARARVIGKLAASAVDVLKVTLNPIELAKLNLSLVGKFGPTVAKYGPKAAPFVALVPGIGPAAAGVLAASPAAMKLANIALTATSPKRKEKAKRAVAILAKQKAASPKVKDAPGTYSYRKVMGKDGKLYATLRIGGELEVVVPADIGDDDIMDTVDIGLDRLFNAPYRSGGDTGKKSWFRDLYAAGVRGKVPAGAPALP